MKPRINYIFRKRLPQYNSIEELFGNIQSQLSSSWDIRRIELPFSGASLGILIKNLRFIWPFRKALNHVTGDVNYLCMALKGPSVLTVHDVQSALKGAAFKRYLKKWLWFRWPARRVTVITVISEFTKTELSQLIPRQAHKIKVVHNPLHHSIQPDTQWKFNAERPKVLLIGTKPNKNLERTLEALSGLAIELIIIGPLSEAQQDLLQYTGLPYTHHERLPFEAVLSCYHAASILCFASLYEGFGMPIIEAQGIGRPVLTSNLGAMKEVAGGAACLVDPYDTAAIRAGIEKIITDAPYRAALVAMGFENVKRFQLNVIAQQYARIYNDITAAHEQA